MEKLNMNKIKRFMNENKVPVISSISVMAMSIPNIVHAADDVGASMTGAMQTIVTQTLSSIAAIAPIGITIFGAMFAWKKGIEFFKNVTK